MRSLARVPSPNAPQKSKSHLAPKCPHIQISRTNTSLPPTHTPQNVFVQQHLTLKQFINHALQAAIKTEITHKFFTFLQIYIFTLFNIYAKQQNRKSANSHKALAKGMCHRHNNCPLLSKQQEHFGCDKLRN